MYICNKCGDVLDELPMSVEYEEVWGHQEHIEYVNDECGCGGEYVEAVTCKYCGEYMPEEYYNYKEYDKLLEKCESIEDEEFWNEWAEPEWRDNLDRLCMDCLKEVLERYNEYLEEMTKGETV